MAIFRFAWRNLWRNPRRTAITLCAVMLTTAILIASYSLMHGMLVHAISNATNLVTGEVQAHAQEYLFRRNLHQAMENTEEIIAALGAKNIPAAARAYGYGLAAHGTKSVGALFWGINPDQEKSTFDLAKYMESGTFLGQTPAKEVVLGRKLAKSLNASVGSEIVLVVQAADGSLGNDLFRVRGILKAAGDSLDREAAIIHRSDFGDLFVMPSGFHEIAVNTKNRMPPEATAAVLAQIAPKLEVKTWRTLLPALSDISAIFDVIMVIFGIVFILAGGLGVMNTMLMATFERIREFGIIKALGATPFRIVRDVAAEALVLTAFASLLGLLTGLGLAYLLQVKGIDTSMFSRGYSLAGVAVDTHWRAVITTKTVFLPLVIMMAVSVVASLYPAVLASRLDPVKAITHV